MWQRTCIHVDLRNMMLCMLFVLVLVMKSFTISPCGDGLCGHEQHAAESLERYRHVRTTVSTAKSTPPPPPPKTSAVHIKEEPVLEVKAEAAKASLTSTKFELLDPRVHQWTLGVCGSTADSSLWLREWLELMLLGGVDHVWLVNDNRPGQDDDTAMILSDYEDRGFVTVIPFPLPSFLPECKGMWVESDCITPKVCHKHVASYVQHFSVTDTDEFMFPSMNCNLKEHIAQNCDPDAAYQYLRWERFGTSGHFHHPKGLMTENFLSSGGDCSAFVLPAGEKYKSTTCKLSWENCLECRHTKVLYNVGKCIKYEQVGWVHEPVNTSHWVKTNHGKQFLPMQKEAVSYYKSGSCKEEAFLDEARMCRKWSREAGGELVKPVPSKLCCSAGFGYNHYGTKSMERWNIKQARATRRGFKPANFATVELNTTISSGVLRFVRALRVRFVMQNYPVSPRVGFIDIPRGRACFKEDGYKYVPDPMQGSSAKEIANIATAGECCAACWDTEMGLRGRCGGWSFHTGYSECTILYAPYRSWKNGEELGNIQWPKGLPASRTRDTDYVSGVPLWDGECPVPEHLKRK
eukprot:TRINITY_DN20660_c0_g1_i1.p1 TRINITY_DN20660_c0_g1~~TRINITY_DN20660_c0_g1_i1.p1  ORF type:complete len:577 (+),score=117.15 TRINITY_DN20660_c0_g1_i1:205-1935(+)